MNTDADLVARYALADLIGRQLLAPPTAADVAEAASLPELAAVMADGPEALAIAYEYLFGRNVYPYESIYRDEELMLNTVAAEQVAHFYAECGFTLEYNVGAPDHIGLELILLARLIATEHTALAQLDHALVRWARQRTATFLHRHIAAWAPIWVRAVQRIPAHPFYQTLTTLLLELLGSELERLAGEQISDTTYIPLQPANPTADETDLSALIRYLITPAKSGIFLSRADCSMLARQLGFSIPIADRFTMARTLFETAGQFDQVGELIGMLRALFATELAELHRLSDTQPLWQPLLKPWVARLADTNWLTTEQ